MHPDHFEERLLVHRVAFARAGRAFRNPRAGQIRLPAHDGRQRRRPVAAVIAVVRNAHRHQQRAQIRITQAQGPEIVRILRDFVGRIRRVVDNNLLRDRYRVDGVPIRFHIELPVGPDEFHQIQRCQIASRIVQEHVFRAGIRRIDPSRVLRRVPAVDRRVELHPRIAALVRRFRNLAHQVASLEPLHRLPRQARPRPPVAVALHRFHEFVGRAHAVVRVLEEDRSVRVPIERGIVTRVDQRVRLLLFLRLAPHKFFDVRMIRVQDHHLRRAPRLAAALDHACECVEALHEAQRSGGLPAARKQPVFLAQRRKIRARPAAPFEQHAFGLRQIQNPFERIAHRIDEARRALRPHLARSLVS